MALANKEDKKGNKKKSGTRSSRADLEEENQRNAELEMQIQGEIEKAQGGDRVQGHVGGLDKEVEMVDSKEQRENTINKDSEFSVVAPRAPQTRSEREPRKAPVTSTKIFENSNFLKRSINDFSFTPEPLIRKFPRTWQKSKDSFFLQILFKLELLSETVESQTTQIVALETRSEELTTLLKRNNQANKANRAETQKIKTMADRVAAITSISASHSGLISAISSSQSTSKVGQSQTSASTVNKTSLNISPDLLQCAVSFNEKSIREIRNHLQALLKASEWTKAIDIQAMSRDNRKDHQHFVFVTTQAQEELLRIHKDEWLLNAFPKAKIQATTLYAIRVGSVNASAILDANTGRIKPKAALSISGENENLSVGRIEWLSQSGKKYWSMILYVRDKNQAEAILARSFMEVGGESAITQVWEERRIEEQRCFNFQKQGHLARACKEQTVCGNCAKIGHHHRDCIFS